MRHDRQLRCVLVTLVAMFAVCLNLIDLHAFAGNHTATEPERLAHGHEHRCLATGVIGEVLTVADTDSDGHHDHDDQPGSCCQCLHVVSMLPEMPLTVVADDPITLVPRWTITVVHGITTSPDPMPDRLI